LEHVDFARSIEAVAQGAYITRAQLGALISGHFARFIEQAQYESTRDPANRIGSSASGGIGIEHLVLIGMVNVSDNLWMADVAVDGR
jgi:hypothetical protein